MAQTKPQHQLIEPLRFSRARHSREDDKPPPFVSADLVHFLPAGFRARSETILKKSKQVAVQVGGREHPFERNLRRLLDGYPQTGNPVFAQMFVRILAAGPVRHHTATLGTQTVDQFVTQLQSGRIGIDGNDNLRQILEMRLHETVEPGQVRVGSGRDGNHALESGGKGRGGIQFAFVDDAGSLSEHGVDVVGNQFGTLNHLEMLRVHTTEFRVDQLSVLEIVEADATLLLTGLRHEFLLFRDAQSGDDALRDATCLHQPTFYRFGKCSPCRIEHRTLEMTGNGCRTTLAGSTPFGFLTLFRFVGNVKVRPAMITVTMPRINVDTQRTVAFVVARGLTFITNSFHYAACPPTDIDIVTGKISHNLLYF